MKSAISILVALSIALPPVVAGASMYMPQANLTDELVSFKTCQELDSHVSKLVRNRGNRDYFGGIGWAKKGRAMMESRAMSAPAADHAGSGAMEFEAAPQDKTGTNNQVANVDEADFVKFNGRHIFQIHDGALKILKAWPASELNQIAALPITGQPIEMLMNLSNAVVLSNTDNNLKATVVDITNPSQPRILTEFDIPGHYRTARLVDDTLRIVNEDYNSYEMSTLSEQDGDSWFRSEKTSRKLNIKPTVQSVNGQTRTLDMIKNCENVWVPKNTTPQVLTRIISIDLKSKKYNETMAYISPQTIYASEGAIYLAQASAQKTAIHKFSIAQGATALYQASGILNGNLINQFALDEHKGFLRVATNGFENGQQVSRVQVLAHEGKRLNSIGKTGDLGKGERLYSARFDGDKGYIVTFRQVDPLYTIDLKNPRNPRVIGELKIPGFSTYIHMLDATHLLAIGQDADENTGRTLGLKLSIFDVSNFAKPREVKSLIFKTGVTSESSYEHKAFTFYREKGILAIPAAQDSSRSSLLLFHVTTSNIKAVGEVNMSDLQSVRRSFFADNFIYAIGGAGIRAATIANPQSPVATVLFNQSVAEAVW